MPDTIIPPALVPNEVAATPALTPQTALAPQPEASVTAVSEDPAAPESTQYLVDLTANKTVKVPSSHVAPMVLSGKYQLPDSGSQYALHPAIRPGPPA